MNGTTTATITGHASLGVLASIAASGAFVVSGSGQMNQPVFRGASGLSVTGRAILTAPIPFIQPSTTLFPALKRISIVMPIPVLDSNGLPT